MLDDYFWLPGNDDIQDGIDVYSKGQNPGFQNLWSGVVRDRRRRIAAIKGRLRRLPANLLSFCDCWLVLRILECGGWLKQADEKLDAIAHAVVPCAPYSTGCPLHPTKAN